MEVSTLISGIKTANTLLGQILSKRGTRIKKKELAVSLMQKAINETAIYLAESNRNYKPNKELADYWLDAFTAMMSVNKDVAKLLRAKSKFWTNPQEWLRSPKDMDFIPDLEELDKRCEELLETLKKRRS